MSEARTLYTPSPYLTKAQEYALCQYLQQHPDDAEAQDRLIRAYIGLVCDIACKKQGWGIDVEDLIQEGTLALLRAAMHFDTSLGFRLTTYATPKISQAMQRYSETYGLAIRLPSHLYTIVRALKRNQHSEEEDEEGNDEALALAAAHPERLAEVRRALHAVLSLDTPLPDTNDLQVGDMLSDPGADTETVALASVYKREIVEVLKQTLSLQEQRIIVLRYGLHNGRDHTLLEIATREHRSVERIRQLETGALAKLRASSLTHMLLAS